MATTKIDVANRALVRVGASTIDSFEDSSLQADVCSIWYELSVEECFSETPWSFARAYTDILSPTGNTPPHPAYTYEFQLPVTDFIKIDTVLNSGGGTYSDYLRVSDHKIYANTNALVIGYTKRVDETLWTSYFQRYVIEKFAADLAEYLMSDGSLRGDLMQTAEALRLAAVAKDAGEEPPQPIYTPYSSLLQVRDF